MRKTVLGTCLALLILSVGITGTAGESIRIAVSVLPQAFFAERVAGSRASLHIMIPKGACPETYEPTPQQLVGLSDSQIYLKVGAPGFAFEDKYISFLSGNRRVNVVSMSDGTAFRKQDPHVWTSPLAVRIAVQNICLALETYDPGHREEYRRNLGAFLREIDVLDQEIKQVLTGKKGSFFMVYHPAWGYYATDYGLTQLAIEEEGKPVNAVHIRKMVDLARQKGIRAVLVQKGFETKSARAIARDIGGEVVETDPLERNWLAGMRHFTSVLTRVLRK